MVSSWMLLAALVACPASRGTLLIPEEIPGRDKEEPVPALTFKRALPSGIVAFDGASNLVFSEGSTLHFQSGQGETVVRHPATVTDLRFASDGRLWVLSGTGVTVYKGAEVILFVPDAIGDHLLSGPGEAMTVEAATWMDDTGAWSQRFQVDPAGKISYPPLDRPLVSAACAGPEGTLLLARDPSERRPRVDVVGTDGEVRSGWPVLDPGQTIVDIATVSGRVIVLSKEGTCEVWPLGGNAVARRLACAGSRLMPLPGKDHVAVGRDRLDVRTGDLEKDAIPAEARAVSPDGRTWVLERGGAWGVWVAL